MPRGQHTRIVKPITAKQREASRKWHPTPTHVRQGVRKPKAKAVTPTRSWWVTDSREAFQEAYSQRQQELEQQQNRTNYRIRVGG